MYLLAWIDPVVRLWLTHTPHPLLAGCFCYLLR